MDLEFIRSARARWIGAGIAVALAAVIALWASVPGLVEARVQEQCAQRGFVWTSRERSVSWRGIEFERVTLAGQDESDIPIVEVERVDVALGWFGALRDPRGAVSLVSLTGVSVSLDVEGLRAFRKEGRARGATGAEPRVSKPLPAVHVRGAEVQLRDVQGSLLRVEIAALELAPDGWKADLKRVELGDKGGEFVGLEGVAASGPITKRRPQLGKAVVASADLTLSSPREDEADGQDRSRLKERIEEVRAALRAGGDAPAEASNDDKEPSMWWTPDARLELRKARVVDGSETPHKPVLEELNLALLAEGAQSLQVKGDGLTTTGGSLSWDLHVAPRDARVEGRVALREVPLVLFAPVLPKLPFHELERTRVAADLAITGHGLETAAVRGELSISELAFGSERLARVPVGPISFKARGEATWTPARRELSALRGELSSGGTQVLITGALAWPKGSYRVDMSAEMPQTKCSAVAATVPAGLLDDLSEIGLAGDIKAKVDVHVDSQDLDSTKLNFTFGDKCKFERLPEAMSVRRFERPFNHRVLEPDGTMFEMQTGPGTPAWTPIELISPFMIQAVVAHEDGRFFGHRGFAESEIGAALARNLKAHAFKFGASTITMQLVKNVFLQRDKLLSRKVQEALIVWWLEQQVSKKWILELYLNVIEYGTGVYGIRNAALHYFGTLPVHLTPAQAAFLATILPNPKSYDEQFAKGTISESTRRRVTSFLQHMRARERIDEEALLFGLEELAQFRFYDPDMPPPPPVAVRGTAQAPPFAVDPNAAQPPPLQLGNVGAAQDSFGGGY